MPGRHKDATRVPLEILFIGFEDVTPDTARALVDRMDALGDGPVSRRESETVAGESRSMGADGG